MSTRYELGTLVLSGRPDIDAATECPECGFDALLAFPVVALSASGVSPFGVYRACSRCFEETS